MIFLWPSATKMFKVEYFGRVGIYMFCRRLHITAIHLTKPYKVLFFGSDNFAVTCLNRLKENLDCKNSKNHAVDFLEVVCPPRSDVPVRQYALKHEIPFSTWPDLPPLSSFDVGVVVSFGRMMPSSVINSFHYGMINVHGSLLPALRGAAPVARAIEMGCKATGVSILKIAANKFDHGLILDQSDEILIREDGNAENVTEILARIGADLCLQTLQNLPLKISTAAVQNEAEVTYAPKLTEKDTYIDWNAFDSTTILNKHRAYGFSTKFHLRCRYEENLIKLAEIIPCSLQSNHLNFADNSTPGEVIYHKRSKSLVIACKSGYITCSKLIMKGRRPLSSTDFYNGFIQTRIKQGQRIYFRNFNHEID